MGSKSQPAHSRGFLLCAAHSRGPVRGAFLAGWSLRARGRLARWAAVPFLPDSSCERGEIRHICGGRKVPMQNYQVCCSSSPDAKVDGIGPSRLPAVLQPRLSGLLSVPEFDCSKLDSFVLGKPARGISGRPVGPWDALDALRGVSGRASGQADAAFGPPKWVLGPRLRVLCELKEERSATGGEAK